jgi:hypothetical protein
VQFLSQGISPKAVEKWEITNFSAIFRLRPARQAKLDYDLLLAKDLGSLLAADYARIADELSEVRKMLSSLLRKVNVDRNC